MINETKKKSILFFARGYQTTLFPKLKSEYYNSYYVALTKKDKSYLNSINEKILFCFEEYLEENIDTIQEYPEEQ